MKERNPVSLSSYTFKALESDSKANIIHYIRHWGKRHFILVNEWIWLLQLTHENTLRTV